MWIGSIDARGVVQLDEAQQLVRTGASVSAIHAEVLTQHFGDLRAHRHRRVERGGRVLVDHGDPAATDRIERCAIGAQKVNATIENAAGFNDGVVRKVIHDGEERGRLAGAGFPDQSHHLVRGERQVELPDRGEEHAAHRETHRKVLDLDERVRHQKMSSGGADGRAGPRP